MALETMFILEGETVEDLKKEIFDEIKSECMKIREKESQDISSNTVLLNDLGLSSYDSMILVATLEDKFEVSLENDDFFQVRKIGDLETCLLKKILET
ncbi:acyl carrier protein [uncultured Vagococcus sp.]|uniref:acyl carrier protein n=1 Tax=uncultured Vagococcus sp. TaxID=189676 RepID=UPI0028D47B7C|nr:acyl carrier protein [uncultured Vagococcus sp.]